MTFRLKDRLVAFVSFGLCVSSKLGFFTSSKKWATKAAPTIHMLEHDIRAEAFLAVRFLRASELSYGIRRRRSLQSGERKAGGWVWLRAALLHSGPIQLRRAWLRLLKPTVRPFLPLSCRRGIVGQTIPEKGQCSANRSLLGSAVCVRLGIRGQTARLQLGTWPGSQICAAAVEEALGPSREENQAGELYSGRETR